jgi:hypothetical protein
VWRDNPPTRAERRSGRGSLTRADRERILDMRTHRPMVKWNGPTT